MKYLYILVCVLSLSLLFSDTALAKGGGGGGRGGGGGARSGSVSKSTSGSTSKTTTSNAKPATPSKPNPQKPTSATKTVNNQQAKTVNGKTYSKTGNVVDENYRPTFRGGYTPPVGSTVYYRDSGSDWLSWIPLWYIMTHDGSKEAVVVQPDGKEQEVKAEGEDGMYVLNWIITILFGVGLVVLVIWLVNKWTQPKLSY